MDLSGIWAEVGRLLSDPNNQRWSQSVITSRANEAQTIIEGYTNAVKTKETLTPTAATEEVALNSATMDILRVVITRTNGDKFPLSGMSREDLDFYYPNWQQFTDGEPKIFFYDATNNNLHLVPPPDAANAITNGLEVWEARKPTDLGSSSDVPFDSTNTMIPYHMAIVHWVVAQCWLDDGTAEALGKSKFHRSGSIQSPGQFEEQVKRIMEKFDSPIDVPHRVKFRLQGGRLGNLGQSKSNPLATF